MAILATEKGFHKSLLVELAVYKQPVFLLKNGRFVFYRTASLNLIEPNYRLHLQMMLIIFPATMVSAFLKREKKETLVSCRLLWAKVFKGKNRG